MSKQVKCYECWGLNGHHWSGCKTRGYSAVGPHPDAPPREAEPSKPTGPAEMCCGGTTVRAVCAYHGPSAATERAPAPVQYEVEDAGLRLLGPDDPEVSTDLVYATASGGVVGVPQTKPAPSGVAFYVGGLPVQRQDLVKWHVESDPTDATRGHLAFIVSESADVALKLRAMYLADRLCTHRTPFVELRVPNAVSTSIAWFSFSAGGEVATAYKVRFIESEASS